jgi:hypothetical protein
MKRVFVFMVAVFFLFCFGTVAFAQGKKVVKERVVTKTAIVEAIDLPSRVVTLKDKDGNLVDLKVSPKATNLAQVKVGDQLEVKYYESIAIQLAKPGTAPSVSEGQSTVKAKPGEKPAGVKANVVTMVATITAIDPNKAYISLTGPGGKTVNANVKDPKNLENVKVGDSLEITYTESLAVSVKTVAKAKK